MRTDGLKTVHIFPVLLCNTKRHRHNMNLTFRVQCLYSLSIVVFVHNSLLIRHSIARKVLTMDFHCKRNLSLVQYLEQTWFEFVDWIYLTHSTAQWQVGFVSGMVLS
jgi:hypothetical protein